MWGTVPTSGIEVPIVADGPLPAASDSLLPYGSGVVLGRPPRSDRYVRFARCSKLSRLSVRF